METSSASPLAPPKLTNQEYLIAIWCHFLSLFTFGIFPLVQYYKQRKQCPFIAYHALQALLFALPILIGTMVSLRFVFPLNIIFPVLACPMWFVYALVSASHTNQARWFEIPLAGSLAKRIMRLPKG